MCSDGLDETEIQGVHATTEFLLSFTGLESIYLQMSNTHHTMQYLQGPILHHCYSLQNLVYYERELVPLKVTKQERQPT